MKETSSSPNVGVNTKRRDTATPGREKEEQGDIGTTISECTADASRENVYRSSLRSIIMSGTVHLGYTLGEDISSERVMALLKKETDHMVTVPSRRNH